MRLYLDTNILVYMRFGNVSDEICVDVLSELVDYGNTLSVSSVCVHEMIHLFQIGKIERSKGEGGEASDVIEWLRSKGIEIIAVNERHLSAYSKLPMYDDHRDPNDRLIIAQAISDRATLISSDRKFDRYKRYGLQFMFNKR